MPKSILITGTSSGIGRHLVRHLASLNPPPYSVIYAGMRKIEHLKDLVEGLLTEEARLSIVPLILDVTDSIQISAAVAMIKSKSSSSLAGIVLNAGVPCVGSVEELDI